MNTARKFRCDFCAAGTRGFKRPAHVDQHYRVYHRMPLAAIREYKLLKKGKGSVGNAGDNFHGMGGEEEDEEE